MKGARGMYPFLNIYKFPQWRYFPNCLEDLFPRREEYPPTPFARGITKHQYCSFSFGKSEFFTSSTYWLMAPVMIECKSA